MEKHKNPSVPSNRVEEETNLKPEHYKDEVPQNRV